LAEIYFDQGKYGKALEIYKDLAQKEPDNEEIAKRKDEIEKLYNDKFGGNA
jgi:cytochrome c-type biogenesis protein CcmH/NrfG